MACLDVGCAVTLQSADWQRELQQSACQVQVTSSRGQAYGTHTLQYDAEGHLLAGASTPVPASAAREFFIYDDRARIEHIESLVERNQDARCHGTTADMFASASVCYPQRVVGMTNVEYDEGRIAEITHVARVYLAESRNNMANSPDAYVSHERVRDYIDYRYDAAGHLVSIDANDTHTEITYEEDKPVRRVVQSRTELITERFEYDERGRVSQVHKERCDSTQTCVEIELRELTYDAQGRLMEERSLSAQEANTADTVRWTYDDAGRVAMQVHRLTRESTRPINEQFAYTYDDNGRLLRVEAAAASLDYAYLGQCDAVRVAPPTPTVARTLGLDICLQSPGLVLDQCIEPNAQFIFPVQRPARVSVSVN